MAEPAQSGCSYSLTLGSTPLSLPILIFHNPFSFSFSSIISQFYSSNQALPFVCVMPFAQNFPLHPIFLCQNQFHPSRKKTKKNFLEFPNWETVLFLQMISVYCLMSLITLEAFLILTPGIQPHKLEILKK